MYATNQQLERALHFARKRGELSAAQRYLTRKGCLCFGVESVAVVDREIQYVNFGETYAATIIEEAGQFSIASWGDWLEEAETDYCEDSGAIRCGYCGEFTPCADNWHETVCESCGRYVDSGELPK